MSASYYEQGGAKNPRAIDEILGVLTGYSKIGRILDIGCGNGAVLKAVRGHTPELFGIDISEQAIELTRQRVPQATLLAADVQNELPFPDAFFDSVLMLDVIEHLENPVAALRQIRRVLRFGGVLAVTTPNANSPLRFVRGERWFGLADPGHMLLYTNFTLVHLLKKSGFNIVSDRTEAFTGTAFDPFMRNLRIGGTLYVVGRKSE